MQPDIRTLITNGQWKQYEGLIVPAYLNRQMLSAVDVSTAVYLTHEDVFGRKYTREELESDLSQLSIEDCIATTSKLLTVLENVGHIDRDAQKGIVQELLASEIKEKVLAFLNQKSDRVVFFELQLLLLAKYAILYAKREPANDFMGMKLFQTFMKIVLGITDLLAAATEGSSLPELQRSAIRSGYFFSGQDLLLSLGRVEELFITIPNELISHHQYLDIPALFQEATGLTIEEYLLLGVSLIALSMEQKPGHFKDVNWYVVPERYFSNTLVSKQELDLLMKEFTIDIQTLETLCQNQGYFEYNFNGLVQHPLVTFDNNRFFPLSLGFLKDKITLQVYWIVFDYIKKTYGEKKRRRYTNFMGACFEEYVYKLLRRIYPSSPLLGNRLMREITYFPSKTPVKTADNILINPSSLILLETKVSQLQVYSTGIVGDLDEFRKDVIKIVVEAFTTIQRTKEDFLKGLLKKELPIEPAGIKAFYPVIVTYGKFVVFPLVWRIVEEEVRKIPNYDPELLDRLQIIQADEIELIEAFFEKSGLSFEELLRRKIADPVYKQLSFHTYFYREFREYRPLKGKYQSQRFDEFAEKMSLKLFGVKADIPGRTH